MLFTGLVSGSTCLSSHAPKVPAKGAVTGIGTGPPFEGLAKGPKFPWNSLGGGRIEATILAHTEAVLETRRVHHHLTPRHSEAYSGKAAPLPSTEDRWITERSKARSRAGRGRDRCLSCLGKPRHWVFHLPSPGKNCSRTRHGTALCIQKQAPEMPLQSAWHLCESESGFKMEIPGKIVLPVTFRPGDFNRRAA